MHRAAPLGIRPLARGTPTAPESVRPDRSGAPELSCHWRWILRWVLHRILRCQPQPEALAGAHHAPSSARARSRRALPLPHELVLPTARNRSPGTALHRRFLPQLEGPPARRRPRPPLSPGAGRTRPSSSAKKASREVGARQRRRSPRSRAELPRHRDATRAGTPRAHPARPNPGGPRSPCPKPVPSAPPTGRRRGSPRIPGRWPAPTSGTSGG